MYQNCPNSGNFGGLQRSQNCIPQQGGPYTATLKHYIHSEASNDHDRDGVGHVSSDTTGSLRVTHCTRCKGGVSDNLPSSADHICARGTTLFIGKRTPPQPLIQRRFTALKLR